MASRIFCALSLGQSLLLSFFSGLFLVGAFEPFGLYWLAVLSPALLLGLWQQRSPREAFWLGYVFGLGLFSGGVYWVYNSVHEFGHAPAAFAIGLTVVFVLYLSLFPALVGRLQAHFRVWENVWRTLLFVPAAWVLAEAFRGWFLTGFPWLKLGYSQTDSLLASFAPVFGVLGVSWVVMVLAVALVALVAERASTRVIGAVVLLVFTTLALLLNTIQWSHTKGQPLGVSLIQGNIAQDDKWKDEWLIPTVERYRDLSREHWGSDLIIWPEAALPGLYSTFEEVILKPLGEEARSHESELITGVLYEEDGRVYNAVITLTDPPGVYRKRHLVPFGEYIPLRSLTSLFEGMVVLPADDITPAREPTLLHAAGITIATSICYEDAYGEEMLGMLPEANLLINVSNDAWFGDSLAPPQHLQMARMRAIEFARPLLRATNTGLTAAVDHKGQIIKALPPFEVGVLVAQVQPREGATLYARWGNGGVLLLMLLSVLVAWLLYRRQSADEIS